MSLRRPRAVCEQEPGRQLEIVSGRAHRDADRGAADANLERLFDRDRIVAGSVVAGIPSTTGVILDAFQRLRHGSEVEDLELDREFVLTIEPARRDARVQRLDVRVVSGLPIARPDGRARLVPSP